jgi:branched-chain amino acid transport system ATP-binding protein
MVLDVVGLRAGYGKVPVLFGIDLCVDTGEIVCLVGPNGAGKTTFLRAVSGLLSAMTGDIRFNGENIIGWRPHQIVRRGLGHCPEGRELFTDMTVQENLLMGVMWKGSRHYATDRVAAMFEQFPILKEKRHQRAASLSGGQQQMLAIARALMPEPGLLLLDEPTDGLAPKIVEEVIASIRLIRDSGTTVLLVEQDVALALEVANRAYLFENGRIALSGPSESLRHDSRILDSYLGEHVPDDGVTDAASKNG